MSPSWKPVSLDNWTQHTIQPETGSDNPPDDSTLFTNDDVDGKPLLFAFEEEQTPAWLKDLKSPSVSFTRYLRNLLPPAVREHRCWPLAAGAIILFLAVLFIMFPSARDDRTVQQTPGMYWEGFNNVSYLFAFGDSWTTLHFSVNGDQPSATNPIGNPEFPGWTSSNGMNYIGYLASKYNQSQIQVYDFAFGGSVIDTHYDMALLDWLDLPHQIQDQFQEYYVKSALGDGTPRYHLDWKPENSLFTTFFGINDVMVYNRSAHRLENLFTSYEDLLTDLYNMSARNFLIVNVPAIDLSPAGTYGKTQEQRRQMKADIKEFNLHIHRLAQHLRAKFHDITIFEYDINALSTQVITDPQSVLQTVVYRNTTHYCEQYSKFEKGQIATEDEVHQCGHEVDEYLWLNTVHVTPPFHEALAAGIQEILAPNDAV